MVEVKVFEQKNGEGEVLNKRIETTRRNGRFLHITEDELDAEIAHLQEIKSKL